MTSAPRTQLGVHVAGGGWIEALGEAHWRLHLPGAETTGYRLAQLDDYAGQARSGFPWNPPMSLSLRARVSGARLPGTWGFGLWNDPFGMGLGLGGGLARLPALPNAAWFFYASPPNHLAFRDDHPAQGFLAATFSSPAARSRLVVPGLLALPALALPAAGRLLRRVMRTRVKETAVALEVDSEEWHHYQLVWRADGVRFTVDGAEAFDTEVSPRGPLGLVLWIDNQYAGLPSSGRLRFGSLPTPEAAWLELEEVVATPL